MFLMREPALDAIAAVDLLGILLLNSRLLAELVAYRHQSINSFRGDAHDIEKY
jgi:hypothetical protein